MARRGWGSITQRDGKFYGRFRQPGTGAPTMRLLKRPDGSACATLAQAEKALGDLRDDVESGEIAPRRAPQDLRSWCEDEYMKLLAVRLAPSSLRAAGAHLERLAAWCEANGIATMDAFRRKHVEGFVQWLIATEGCKPSYVARLVRTLRAAWRDAETRGLVNDADIRNAVEIRIGPADKVPWISPERLGALYAAVTEAQRPLVTLLGESGVRVGEAFALKWCDVELDGDRPSLFVRHGKTAASRRKVPLTPRAAEALRSVVSDSSSAEESVFSARTSQGVRESVRRACRKIGLPMLRTHSLRHVCASHLAQAGVPATTIARVLGHADGGVLVMQRYGRWMPVDAESAAMDRMSAWRAASTAPKTRRASEETSPAERTNPGRRDGPAVRLLPAKTAAGA